MMFVFSYAFLTHSEANINSTQGTILKMRVMEKPKIMNILYSSLSSLFTPVQKAKLLEKYFPETQLSSGAQFTGLLNLISDLRFHLAVVKTAEGYVSSSHKKKAYRYHFTQVRFSSLPSYCFGFGFK